MSETLPTLDVVVPCYNEAESIGSCLDALLAQASDLHQIILVDNNSSDKTVEVIERYQKDHEIIRLIRENHQGVQFARNTGFDAATGDIVGRIDADTIVQDGWAHTIRTYYAEHQKVGAASGYSWYYDLPGRQITQFFTWLFSRAANQKLADSHLIYGANMTIRGEVWRAIAPTVCMMPGIMEDQDLGLHIIANGAHTGYIPGAKAKVSGRRMRMSPLRYWRYNRQWWMTYENHGKHGQAFRIRMMAWLGNFLQALAWIAFQVHNPVTNRYSLSYLFKRRDERKIP